MKKLLLVFFVLAAFGAGWYGAWTYTKRFLTGENTEILQDPAALRETYAQQAAAGDAEAAYKLGEMYLSTQGGEADAQSAVTYFRLAAGKGFLPAQKELARFYKEGLAGLQPSREASLFWCMHAALQGDANCQNQVKEAFAKNTQLYDAVLAAFTASVQAHIGNGPAALELGRLYEEGFLSPDLEEAAHWYSIAAQQKIPAAQARLGLLYADGKGVVKNEEKARALLAPAAEAGDPQAQLYWGKQAYTQSEQDGGPDYAEAFKWFANAAAQGNVEAQYLTGVMYMQGQGTEKSVKKALQFFSRAAEAGYADAQYVVGQSYYKGLGIRQNMSEARKWLGKAAQNGNQAAQELLQQIPPSSTN